jgi:hypothetical protein
MSASDDLNVDLLPKALDHKHSQLSQAMRERAQIKHESEQRIRVLEEERVRVKEEQNRRAEELERVMAIEREKQDTEKEVFRLLERQLQEGPSENQ